MAQMTDNGDGTYNYNYSVSNDGAVTVIVRLISGAGIKFVWYNNINFSGSPGVTNSYSIINFSTSGMPSGIGTNNLIFTVNIKAQIKAPSTNTFTFYVNQDDGCDLWIGGVKKVNRLVTWGNNNDAFSVSLVQDKYYDLLIKWVNAGGPYTLTLQWSAPGISTQL